MAKILLYYGLLLLTSLSAVKGNSEAKRLYNHLLVESGYNKLIRPVANNSDTLTVKLGLRLSQLIGIDEKNQIMTTNVWLSQEWMDLNLKWNPDRYGGVEVLYVPSESLWLPDIVLFNNADGNYQVTLMTKATVYYTGKVVWEPPAIYKSTCTIDVEFFPFDEQTCVMKFGSWTYNGLQVDLKHKDQVDLPGNVNISKAIDLSGYYESFIWELLSVPARRNKVYYDCCTEPFSDVTFEVTIRRKTLFYTVNLIIPSVAISFLTVFVFYLPADSGEKITLCISILLSLTVFFLLLADLIPPTSLVVPLIGKYLLFTMILVTLSVIITVVVLNIDNRSEATHTMTPWVRKVCLQILPTLLLIRRPQVRLSDVRKPTSSMKDAKNIVQRLNGAANSATPLLSPRSPRLPRDPKGSSQSNEPQGRQLAPQIELALDNVRFIADHLKEEDRVEKIQEDWKYVALVVDRLFFWLFTTACLLGTFGIIFQAPTLYASTKPMNVGM